MNNGLEIYCTMSGTSPLDVVGIFTWGYSGRKRTQNIIGRVVSAMVSTNKGVPSGGRKWGRAVLLVG